MTLKELRQQSKKTVAEVAAALGVAVQTVYSYEQGLRLINVAQIIPLAELYEVSEREIIEAQLKSVNAKKSKVG